MPWLADIPCGWFFCLELARLPRYEIGARVTLKGADDLSLPADDAVTQKYEFIGRGSRKGYDATGQRRRRI